MTLDAKLMAAVISLAIGYGASLGIASAQEPTVAQPEPPVASAPQINDEKLKSFAVAFLEVTKVTQSYKPQIDAAATPEDQQRLQKEAGERMIEAVNDTNDITVDEYNEIIQAAQADPELAQRINTHISQAVETQPAAD